MNNSPPPPCLGYRHSLMFLGLCGLAICYIMRISPAITIISMVKSAEPQKLLLNNTISEDAKKFDWTPMQQNTILSSFFYSYFVMQLPAGWLVQYTGGKWTFAAGVSMCGVIGILIPKLVEQGGFTAFLLLRLSQGLLQGLCYPSIHRLAGYWYPPREYASLSGAMHSGYIVGTIAAMVGSGYLINTNELGGWPLPFYVSGILALVWLPAWLIFISETPSQHPWISATEASYINQSLMYTHVTNSSRVPWRQIATSAQVWLIMSCYVMDGWENYTLLVCVPQYMDSVLKVPIGENGGLSSLPYVGAIVFMLLITPIDRLLHSRNYLSMPNARKLWSCLSSFGKAILLLTIAYLDVSHKTLIIVLLITNVTLSSATLLGFNLADLDLAPPYAGFLFSIFNACSTFSGIIAPLVVGAFTTHFEPVLAWRNVFILASAISFLCGFIFLLYGHQAPLAWVVQECDGQLLAVSDPDLDDPDSPTHHPHL